MALISKEAARSVAKLLTAKKHEEVEKLKQSFEKAVYEAYNRTVPAAVKRMAKAHPKFFIHASTIRLDGNGWRHRYVPLPEPVIVDSKSSIWTPDGEDNKRLTALGMRIEAKREQLSQLTLEIETTLLALKTYKRIEEQFNEAFVLLPQSTSTAISINVQGLRSKLAS